MKLIKTYLEDEDQDALGSLSVGSNKANCKSYTRCPDNDLDNYFTHDSYLDLAFKWTNQEL